MGQPVLLTVNTISNFQHWRVCLSGNITGTGTTNMVSMGTYNGASITGGSIATGLYRIGRNNFRWNIFNIPVLPGINPAASELPRELTLFSRLTMETSDIFTVTDNSTTEQPLLTPWYHHQLDNASVLKYGGH